MDIFCKFFAIKKVIQKLLLLLYFKETVVAFHLTQLQGNDILKL